MTNPELSKTALAQMLRTLADRVDSGADVFEVSMETENIGHATKTTIIPWGLRKPTPEDVERHRRMVHLTNVSRVRGICPVDQPHTCGVYRERTPERSDWRLKWRIARIDASDHRFYAERAEFIAEEVRAVLVDEGSICEHTGDDGPTINVDVDSVAAIIAKRLARRWDKA